MSEQTITVTLAAEKKPKPDPSKLEFGKVFTDHMFMMDYTVENGWHNAQILPYQPITLDPASVIFHYGQAVFEGMKAYLTKEEKVLLFRPEKNMERLNKSNERLCIPEIDEDFALDALKQLINIDKDWIPSGEGTSLYIRPFVISTQPFLGVAASISYKFMIILSPVGSYYKEGVKPVKIFVENEYVRAVAGGTGSAKTAGNYAASLKAQQIATQKGYSQVLWLDGVEKKYVEEVGAMNVFFKIGDEVITPALNGSILEGVTRRSVMDLLKHWDIPVVERRISVEEIFEAHKNGELKEAFGTGTAAVISPIGEFLWNETSITLNNGETGELAKKVYDTLTDIQNGRAEDPFGWTVEV
ncbi:MULTISPECIES: branched-chain amino acid aminotransferase [Bacillaceae]|uniref:branched-chain amino acid aminotransferase n=1 Tax=Bacillaceae TaxID=186817 RepID=UPI001E3FA8C7|nr:MULTISPECIES: branched-chain amino acid aminotransferase [Bacillaceae]MCE4047808.1 branched-chain amino acid aminotransferase [Bacillus sp. Au-Bac7]MCM3031253.1 branched-chain amino acid aminotransferase [Niallia sp. MER 6]MDL0434831.1 branched-chain amino acid aminotransferase [Niallia sp. SS-2023]UPO89348.1 branched-chain amino acid aminotransferase [Niallia sp. Man26]